jgi:hypothetical protein
MSKKGPVFIGDLISKIESSGSINSPSHRKNNKPTEEAKRAYQFISDDYNKINPKLNSSEPLKTSKNPVEINTVATQPPGLSNPISNQLATSRDLNKQPVSNHISNQLATSRDLNKQPVSNQLGGSENPNKQPVSNHISNQLKGAISNQLATTLATRKIWKFTKVVHENLTYLHTMDLVARLCGNKRKVLMLICKRCTENRSTSSGPITTDMLRQAIGGNSNTANTVVERLIIQGFIWRDKRIPGKRGTGGFSCFCTTAYIRDAVTELWGISNQLATTLATSETRELATSKQPHKQPVGPSSSSIKSESLKTTTTTKTKPELPDEWKEIDCAPLREQSEGFGEDHLRRLWNLGTTTPSKVQENIRRIAFAVKHKTQRFTKTPVAMLMGLAKSDGEFDPPKGYYSGSGSIKDIEDTRNDNTDPQLTLKSERLETEAALEARRQIAALTAHLKEMPKN